MSLIFNWMVIEKMWRREDKTLTPFPYGAIDTQPYKKHIL